jgi:hypothetical protein
MIYFFGAALYTGRAGAAVPQARFLVGYFLTIRVEGIIYETSYVEMGGYGGNGAAASAFPALDAGV